jgi:hypothetical protein
MCGIDRVFGNIGKKMGKKIGKKIGKNRGRLRNAGSDLCLAGHPRGFWGQTPGSGQ